MKKIISLILMAVMLVGSIPFASASDSHEAEPMDLIEKCPVCGQITVLVVTEGWHKVSTADICREYRVYHQYKCPLHGFVTPLILASADVDRVHEFKDSGACIDCDYIGW